MTGLYTTLTGALSKIVATGDAINGKTISTINFGPGGFSENQIVIEADFTDGSQAIAATTINFNRCPQTQGSWKNHVSQWPVKTLVLGNQNYSQADLLNRLGTSSTSDAACCWRGS